jgi:hypothetical protein
MRLQNCDAACTIVLMIPLPLPPTAFGHKAQAECVYAPVLHRCSLDGAASLFLHAITSFLT